jgi:hypothetical protein
MNTNHRTPPPLPTPLCALFDAQVALLGAGVLQAHDEAGVHVHLAECAYCQARLREYERVSEALRILVHADADSAAGEGSPPTVHVDPQRPAADRGAHMTLDEIMRASQARPESSSAQAPGRSSFPPSRPRPGRLSTPPRRLRAPLGAIAAVLVLAVLAASLFGVVHFPYGPAGMSSPTPTPRVPSSPYAAAAPGLPCQPASGHWSGDHGQCLSNPPRTRLVSQGQLLAVMRWDATSYHFPDSFRVSVQVTLETANTAATLEIDNRDTPLSHRITCDATTCSADPVAGRPPLGSCHCAKAGPQTLAITVHGSEVSFFVGNTLLGRYTEPSAVQVNSIGLSVTVNSASAQGAQAVLANFAVVAD